jgi:hypothetical protein
MTVNEDSELTTVPGDEPMSKRIADAAAAAHAERRQVPSADATAQMNEAPAEAGGLLGVVAPHDPDVPPLPPERAEHTATMPGDDATLRRPKTPEADATLTRAQPPPRLPDSTITQAILRDGPIAEPPLPPPSRPADAYHERSSDHVEEARRLGGEARLAAEQAGFAAHRAEAAARAAALAGEAALLAAAGDAHEAIQKLREAQMVDEALKRGERLADTAIRLDADRMARGYQASYERPDLLELLTTRQGATLLVVAVVSLMAVVIFVVWLV